MGHLPRLKPGRTLLWLIFAAILFLGGCPKPVIADDAWGIFIVDGVRYANIGAAYSACTTAGYTRCEIWDYNLINGETMSTLPWTANGSEIPVDLHLGPGKLIIGGAFTFAVPKLSRVSGAGRTSQSQPGGTVIQAGTGFSGGTLVQVGDGTSASPVVTFGSLLSDVTVDCNYVSSCTGIENFSAQEQSGLEHVNVINYATRGIYVHGSSAQNSHYTDVEVNGCLITNNCIISSTSVPFEIDNVPALRPVSGITVNPVNTTSTPNIGTNAATCSGGVASIAVSNSFSVGQYVSISGVSVSGYNGTYQLVSGTTSTTLKYNITCPGSSGSNGNAALVPTYDVLVCSSSTCNDHVVNNPTPVTFIGAHFEHGQYGIDALGAGTTLDLIGGSCPIHRAIQTWPPVYDSSLRLKAATSKISIRVPRPPQVLRTTLCLTPTQLIATFSSTTSEGQVQTSTERDTVLRLAALIR